MVLPMRPKGSEGLTEEELSMLVTRDSLMRVGTGILVWVILFLPVTALIIQPSTGRIEEILSLGQNNNTSFSVFDIGNLDQSFRGIAISAMYFI